MEDGLPSESIKGLLYDEPNNKLWISTDRVLSCLNLSSYQFINFGLKYGIVGTEFNDMSFEKGANRLARCKVAANLQFVKCMVSTKCNAVKFNKMKYACRFSKVQEKNHFFFS